MDVGYTFFCEPPTGAERRTSVLVVDDEPESRSTIARALQAEGYDVRQAADGYEALELFIAHRADVVVTDLYMAGKNGLELVREIRALAPEARLIAMSGGSETGEFLYLGMIRDLAAAATIRKPFRHEALAVIVKRALGRA
jgi:CheY-like chemotaxis protein